MPTAVAETITELRSLLADERAAGRRVALVPTMGALHDGHLALIERAGEIADTVVVSIFVNPLQFGPTEDLDLYPRTLADDLDKADRLGVDFVFAPTAHEMYPSGASETRVTAGAVGSLYEGRSRVGHFDGVLTAVSKLLNIVQADYVLFGQKDAQQVFLVSRMVRDLNVPVRVEVVSTVRDPDGLALSSRNRYLDARELRAARGLSIALEAAESSADRGIDAVLAAAQSVLMGESLVQLDYLTIVHPDTFLPVDDDHHGKAIVLVAARVGSTRLIDNATIYLRGTRS
ncbi:pantoate--beta-alanine ligase [Lacisediminihabitans sp.]|uniref:pantoate--beta-alanine ligase n=1 Tax=Lacisediminihabitans sp. TaxID=2787631 RepID=UPI002F91D2BB